MLTLCVVTGLPACRGVKRQHKRASSVAHDEVAANTQSRTLSNGRRQPHHQVPGHACCSIRRQNRRRTAARARPELLLWRCCAAGTGRHGRDAERPRRRGGRRAGCARARVPRAKIVQIPCDLLSFQSVRAAGERLKAACLGYQAWTCCATTPASCSPRTRRPRTASTPRSRPTTSRTSCSPRSRGRCSRSRPTRAATRGSCTRSARGARRFLLQSQYELRRRVLCAGYRPPRRRRLPLALPAVQPIEAGERRLHDRAGVQAAEGRRRSAETRASRRRTSSTSWARPEPTRTF